MNSGASGFFSLLEFLNIPLSKHFFLLSLSVRHVRRGELSEQKSTLTAVHQSRFFKAAPRYRAPHLSNRIALLAWGKVEKTPSRERSERRE